MTIERYPPSARPGLPHQDSLADILERVLDKGIVIAGDIQINLLDIELLTIKLRLLVASVDKAKEMGINWWESDPALTKGAGELEEENRMLRARVERLERLLPAGEGESAPDPAPEREGGAPWLRPGTGTGLRRSPPSFSPRRAARPRTRCVRACGRA